jgi:acyl carrier protein
VASQYIAPRTEVEETLARIWSAILALERIGVNDNFFELGGHSLLATQVISRVRETFNVDVPLRQMFELPTIADFAVAVVQSRMEVDIEQADLVLQELERLSLTDAQKFLSDL